MKMWVIFIIILLIANTGCIDQQSEVKYQGKTVIKCCFSENQSISPVGFNNNQLTLLPNIYNGLVEFDGSFQLVPSLAVSWSNPEDNIWHFQLRKNVSFHNGAEFTSQDVAFSIYQYYSLSLIVENITLINSHSIDIITKEPEPMFLQKIARNLFIYPHNYSLVDNDYWRIGTGPYQLSEYVEGNYSKISYFEDYWGEKPDIENVYLYVISDEQQRIDKFLNGDFDLIEYNINESINNLSHLTSIDIHTYSPLSTYILGFDMRVNDSYGYSDGMNPTSYQNIRKAMYHAINDKELIEEAFQGYARTSTQLLTTYHFGYTPTIKRLEYNISLAKALLNESIFPDGFHIELDAITIGFDYNKKQAELIKNQLGSIGINVTINNLTTTEFHNKVIYQKNTSLWLVGWTINSIDGGLMYPQFFMSEGDNYQGFYNSGHYVNAEVDQIGLNALHEMDIGKRNDLFQKGYRIAQQDDIAIIPLLTQELILLTVDNLELKPRADSTLIFEEISFQ